MNTPNDLSKLPELCLVRIPGNPPPTAIGIVKRGHSGYYPSKAQLGPGATKEDIDNLVKELNDDLGVTQAQMRAMLLGSMCGWDAPGADPDHPLNQSHI